jgi:drug/metabolite transporter (DMT)-like permease
LVALIYGANYTIAKDVMGEEYVQPSAFILLRVGAGAITFLLIHNIFIREKVDKKDYKLLFLCAIFGVVVNQLLFFEGLKMTSHIHAALIATTIPITVLIASSILIKEKITRQKMLGIFLGISGAILLILYGKKIAYSENGLLGDVLIFINAVSYGVYLVLVKTLMTKYNPITVLKWVFLFGCIFVVPIGMPDFLEIQWSTFTTYIWIGVLYVMICTTVLTYLFNAYALKIVNPSVVGIYVYLQPLLATTIALILGRDFLTLEKLLAGVLIFIGVYFVSKKQKIA